MFAMKTDSKGYITLVLIFFVLILAFFLFPRKYAKEAAPNCYVGQNPPGNIIVQLPPIKDKYGNPLGEGGGGPDLVQPKVPFKLVRVKVPVRIQIPGDPLPFWDPAGRHVVPYNITQDTDGNEFQIYYSGNFSELDFYKPFLTRKYSEEGLLKSEPRMLMRFEGFIYYVYLNSDGTPLTSKDGKNYITDVYQELSDFNDTEKGYDTSEVFICTEGGGFGVALPDQSTSPDNQQLQLEWFLFKSDGYLGVHCKPAIYLYPKEKTLVNVKVKPLGPLTYTNPQYNYEKGWSVWASPNGVLTTNYQLPTTNYPYLYYEAKIPDAEIKKPTQGWVVKYEELDNLYKEILPKLGLNEVQSKDFRDYWNKHLPKDSLYYFVGVIDQENINRIEPLEITPKPDYINRVAIYFERLDSPKQVEVPKLPTTNYQLQTSDSFRVIEWGGLVKNDPDHPFTCSQ